MPYARVLGTGASLPEQVVTNDMLAERFGIETDDAWIFERTGIRERRFAAEGVGTAELAAHAARAALADAAVDATDLDLIVFCTLSPDRCFPGSGVLLQSALGLPAAGCFVPCMEIRNQCAGFLYGLSHVDAIVRAGRARRVLLVGAEIHSAALDLSTRGRAVASLFGDGAAAVVFGADEETGVLDVRLGADGSHADDLTHRIWDIRKRPFIHVNGGVGQIDPEDLWPQMNGQVVFRHAVLRMEEALREVCAANGVSVDDVRLFCFHQANARINATVQERLGIPPERAIHNIERFGNTTSATIPLLLDEAKTQGRVQRGDLVALVAFGSGFTWGASLLRW